MSLRSNVILVATLLLALAAPLAAEPVVEIAPPSRDAAEPVVRIVPPPPEPGAAVAQPPGQAQKALEHRLAAGDELEIHILALPDQSQRTFPIRSDGGFYHPIAGEVQAAGLTLQDLQTLMERRLARDLRNPKVRVGLRSMALQEVTVLGEVVRPGQYQVKPGTSMLDVLAMAGGSTPKADMGSAVLMRQGVQSLVDLTPPDPTAEQVSAVPVAPGDVLYLLPGTQVSVGGDVATPGVYSLPRHQADLQQALQAAGGARPGAALNRVVLQRASLAEPVVLDLSTPEAEIPAGLLPLRSGDMLTVPPRQVVLLGGISKAGPMPIQGGENVLEVILAAGIADPGVLGDVTLIRGEDLQAGRQKVQKVDLRPYIKKGDTSVLLPVYDGDVVYVPPIDKDGGFNPFSLFGGFSILRRLIRF